MDQEPDIDRRLAEIRTRVDLRLAELVPEADVPPVTLHEAMRHSLLASGKRVRAVITVLTAEALGKAEEQALDPACAIEMVHTASLILDDLPSMDDASLRRGRRACHRAFGENVALLASFALLNRAYAVLADAPGLEERVRLELIEMLARRIGDDGLIAGQVRDLQQWSAPTPAAPELERLAREKTGALFVAGAEAGAVVAGVATDRLEPIQSFAWNFGLCFQALDDLVDSHGIQSAAGKNVRQDGDKATFVSVLGPARAREHAQAYLAAAHEALGQLGSDAAPLGRLANFLLESTGSKVVRR